MDITSAAFCVPMQRQRRQPAQQQGQASTAPLQHLGLTSAQQQQVVDMRARLEPRQKDQSQMALQAEAPAELAELDKVSQGSKLWQHNSGPPAMCAASCGAGAALSRLCLLRPEISWLTCGLPAQMPAEQVRLLCTGFFEYLQNRAASQELATAVCDKHAAQPS